jgi:hypothetical protein
MCCSILSTIVHIYMHQTHVRAQLSRGARQDSSFPAKFHAQKDDFLFVPPCSQIESGMHAMSKTIVTRVGFEPTPFRTSVLEEP